MTKEKNEKSFTITELLVIIFIVSLMSALVLPRFRAGERQFALQASSYKLAQNIRRAQELTMSAHHYDCGAGWKMKGYGIFLDTTSNDFYSLNARCEDEVVPGIYKAGTIEQVELEKGIIIKELKVDGSSQIDLNVFFFPPDPLIVFGGTVEARITLCLRNDPTTDKDISVNMTGLITIE